MAQGSFSPAQIEKLLALASKQLGTTPDQLKQAFEQSGLAGISSSLSAEDAAKAQTYLQDKEKAAQLLNDPQVQKLLKQLLGDR